MQRFPYFTWKVKVFNAKDWQILIAESSELMSQLEGFVVVIICVLSAVPQ